MKKHFSFVVLILILGALILPCSGLSIVSAQNAPDKDLTVSYIPLFAGQVDESKNQIAFIRWQDNNNMPKLSNGYAYMSFISLKNTETGEIIKIKDYATQKQVVSGQYIWNASKTSVNNGDYKIIVEVYEFSSGELAGRGESKNYFKVK